MPDKDLIEIRISRVIPAKKWKVVRLLTKVWEFPLYMPNVKEASVIQKSGHQMKTKWRVQVDNVPISWVEEDMLLLDENTISFRANEGDLEEFRGAWIFKDHPEGTEVTLQAYLKVGIPAIKDFTDPYIKKLLTRNFEAILEALERRLISIRYAGYKKGDTRNLSGFGIIGHLYNFNHLETCLKMLNPNFKMPSREFLGQLFNLTPSFKLYDIINFKSKTGSITNGCFIVATFIPDMIEKDMWTIFSKVVRACKIAEKHGVGIVTLGGFTSIVAERIGHEITKEVDVAVTTGNTFTAAMAIDGVVKAAGLLGVDLAYAKAAIIGGTGDIGSACARVLADKVKQLTITGRTKTNLQRLSKELSKKRKAKIIATTNNEAAVRDADIVIAAAAATSAILSVDWFKSGAIICDVGYPKNISYAPVARQDIFIFSGGLAKSPTPISFPIDVGLPAADTIYGCFSEAIILDLEKRYENFSFGRGNITPEKMDEIRNLGKRHGFEVSDFYWGHRLIDETIIAKTKEAVKV
ncbi:MAG: SRPBCC family protein [Candidatus Omnitrophota bacterium]|nr:SRPBCC family protein [Candidatus Omnitrophota bacterium]